MRIVSQLGVEATENLSGTFVKQGQDDEGRVTVAARILARDPLKLVKERKVEVEGTMDMEGFADDVPLTGAIALEPRERRLRYQLDFVANDGTPCHFDGAKELQMEDPYVSATTLAGKVTDATGRELADVTLRFDLKNDWLPFLISLRRARP